MQKLFLIFFLFAICRSAFAQADSAAIMSDINQFRQKINNEYRDAKTSPLPPAKRKVFKGIHFFASGLQYVVKARFVRTPTEKTFNMPTSGAVTQAFVKYGEVTFTLLGKEHKLSVYQSVDLAKTTEYKDYLVILFKDQTNGNETYGGGRYIDLTIPKGDSITINFNKAYQPYCAYAEGYTCPIPPAENNLPVRVEAGVRF